MGLAATQLALTVVAAVAVIVLAAWIRRLAKSQRGARAELRRLRKRQEYTREEQQKILASLGYAHGSLEVLQKMVRCQSRPPEEEVELERVDWEEEGPVSS